MESAIVQFRLKQLKSFENDCIERIGLELRRCWSNGMQKLGDDVIEPIYLALGDSNVLFEPLAQFRCIDFSTNNRRARAAAGFWRGYVCLTSIGEPPEFSEFTLHELQMDMEGIERIPDLMSDAGCQQRQSLDPLALNSFERALPRFGGIV